MSKTRALFEVGDGGGVCSTTDVSGATALSCDRFWRLLGCESGDCEPVEGMEGVDADDEEGRPEDVLEVDSAARAACVMGM